MLNVITQNNKGKNYKYTQKEMRKISHLTKQKVNAQTKKTIMKETKNKSKKKVTKWHKSCIINNQFKSKWVKFSNQMIKI